MVAATFVQYLSGLYLILGTILNAEMIFSNWKFYLKADLVHHGKIMQVNQMGPHLSWPERHQWPEPWGVRGWRAIPDMVLLADFF